jgi:GNAT superfamily N-acetyltransferase
VAERARAWHHAVKAAVCDVLEPWAHGTVVRATRYPSYWDYNSVRVEEDPGMSVEALVAFADEALAGLDHRRVDFEQSDSAEALRPGFEELGWLTERLVWMHHAAPPPPPPDIPVEEVPYDAVRDLRVAWHLEDFPGHELNDHLAEAAEVARLHGARVLAVREAGEPVAFAQLEHDGQAAEIAQVYVHPEHRGRGLGTAMTCAAIEAAGDVEDLWIVADDAGRPKELYSRLGFRPVWTEIETLRLP